MYKTKLFEKFVDLYKNYDITDEIRYESNCIVINNPNWDGGDIEIFYDGDIIGTTGEILLSFSYHHEHYYDFYYSESEKENYADYYIKDLSKPINKILQGEIIAVGFLVDEKPVLGEAAYIKDIEMLSAKEIFEKLSVGFREHLTEHYEKIKGRECHCAVRGWDKILSKNLYFII